MATKNFEIYFEGEMTQMDVNTLITSLVSTSTLIQQVNQMVDPQRNVEIKIKPFAPGSFRILSELWMNDTTRSLFVDGVTMLSNVLDIFVGFLGLKKHLKGELPKGIVEKPQNKIEVENINGDKMIFMAPVYNIYATNQVANDAASKAFEVLSGDENVDGLKIKEGSTVVFDASRVDFNRLAKKHAIEAETSRAIIREGATLNIVKLAFQEDYKWGFFYDGNRITASIVDEDFFRSVDEGERFAKGDTLLVNLKITQRYDPSVNTYVNDAYEVIKVTQHIPRPEQHQQSLLEE